MENNTITKVESKKKFNLKSLKEYNVLMLVTIILCRAQKIIKKDKL